MRRSLLTIAIGFTAAFPTVAAAEPVHALQVSAGLGLAAAAPQNGVHENGTGSGGYASVEYVYQRVDWATPRLYTGLLLSTPQSDCGAGVSPCDVSANIFFLGGKLRLMAPIPYVGPFLEAGIGLSAGHISTRSGYAVDVTGSGIMYHVPFALGLALGPRHEYDIAFQYLFHPEQKQFCGAFALGVRFGLD